ncbi:SMODS-associated NUDIX domain-containing protein [Actinokineospora diospyrosa]|uniref:CD-NTase-associated protein 16 NUDIX domain-containing protein n=1 Tax=Actinokineospora diospyrosa TaxID=103728 RepID=A0ABT1IKF8_9PSEU|nr:hypothetical protein [Actinokineospora diospyrosa]MCP2273137.1 hypothetical protein [Actinokineospora diospyrosa]
MQRLVFYLVLILAALIAVFFVKDAILVGLIGGIATGFAVPFVDTVWNNLTNLRLLYASIRYRNATIRVSFSYLFRIEDEGKLLLVHGRRIDQFQPVGGVYKANASASGRFREWGVQSDDLIPIDKASTRDIRLRVPGRHLYAFVRWFESGKDRETSPWREFYEELLATKILPSSEFPYIHHNFVRQEVRPLRYSDHAQSLELLVADIYELEPTDAQLTALRETKTTNSPDFRWSTPPEIRRRGATPGQHQKFQISETANWTL